MHMIHNVARKSLLKGIAHDKVHLGGETEDTYDEKEGCNRRQQDVDNRVFEQFIFLQLTWHH